MKIKKKVYRMVTAVLLMAASVFVGTWGTVPVQAAALTVYINGTELQNGKYYEFVTSGFTHTMYEVDSDSGLTDYISYNNGVMEVHGNVEIYSDGTDTEGVLRIKNGTLTLTGDGSLYVKNSYEAPAASVVTGTSDSVLKTDSYTGSITFSGDCGESLVQGLALVDLKTTSDIGFTGSYITGDSFISAGSVKLEANDYYFNLTRTVNVKHFIEATDTQNGKISISKTGTTNALRLKNGTEYNCTLNVSDAFFKAKDTVIASNGSNGSDESIFFNGNSITEGNLEIQSKYDVTIKTKNTLADGNLKITTSDMGDYVTLTSEAGSLSTGDTDINALSARTTLKGKGPDAVIKGNATIKAEVLEITGDQNSAIAGNANLTTVSSIELSSAEGYSVIAGSTIQMDAGNCDISISRDGSGATDTPPILGGTLQASRGAVRYEDGGTRWMQLMETGKIYYADSCEHPIVSGDYGHCLVCGGYIAAYAEVIGADGTSKGMLSENFGGGYPTDDLQKYIIGDGDTIKFLTDVYCPARNASMRANIAVKFDLNGHALTVQSVSSSAGLAIMNGTYAGNITGNSSNGVLTLRNTKATLPSLSWNNSTTGVKLEGSQVTIAAAGTADTCRFEKLTMDESSTLVLQNATDGISNGGLNTLEDSLGSIQDFLPKGYSLTNTNSVNTIVDSNGNPAANIVLRYRKLTDNDVNITMDTVFVYDKTAKEPELLVTYEGQELEKGTDYTVAYTNNVNAGNAVATITGKGAYHGSVQLPFTIEKANQAAPAGILAINVSKSGMQDGAIENLSTAMEYSTDGINWITVASGTRMNELAAGDYYVRYAATENYLASPATKIVVGVAKAATTEAGSTSEATTAGANGTTAVETKIGGKGEKHVATGDETPLEMLLILMLSTSGIAFAVIAGNKKKHN